MAFSACGDDGANPDDLHKMFGPGHVDHEVRQAIQICWLSLPKERRTVEEVDRQIRRIVDRALNDFREDGKAFSDFGGDE